MSEEIKSNKTPTGTPFQYSRAPDGGLIVYCGRKTRIKISADEINLIKNEIDKRGSIRMGACRDKPTPFSLGELLQQHKKAPQHLSYLLPVLRDEGFCRISGDQPFNVYRNQPRDTERQETS